MKWPRIEPGAATDIEESLSRFALAGPALEAEFASTLRDVLAKIATTPRRYARLETNKSDREIRRAILWRFNYLVIYKVENDIPTIVAVMHGSRQPDAWQRREQRE